MSMFTREQVTAVEAKEKELLRLLQVKSEKIANIYLTKEKHTQLSYLNKDEQSYQVSLPKGILLDRLMGFLKRL